MSDINLIAVVVAAVASFIFGALWYSPLLFLQSWCQETGVNPNEDMANPARVYGSTFVLTLLAVIALAFYLGPAPELKTALLSAFLIGVCFTAGSLGINYQFANCSFKHWAIDSGFHIVRFTLMGLILGLWH